MHQIPRFIMNLGFGLTAEIVVIASIIGLFLLLIMQGAVAYGVYEVLRGNAAQFGKSLSRGLARTISLSLGILLFYAAFVLIAALGGIGFIIVDSAFGSAVGVIIVVLPLAVIAMALFYKWIVFVPACVVERAGPIKSLSRSSELTQGCRLKIFALYAPSFIVLFIVSFVTALSTHIHPVFFVVELFVDAIPIAFLNVMTAVIYYELRSVKEGISVDKLASVFD